MVIASGLLARLVVWAFNVFYLLLLVRVILSFLRFPPWHWATRTLGRWSEVVTEPVLAPVRRILDPYQRGSGVDFSPLVVWLLADLLVKPLLLTLLGGR